MAIEIPLTQGYVALVDDVDADLGASKWYCTAIGYAARDEGGRIERVRMLMHRVILQRVVGFSLRTDQQVDHINMNRLDNRRENLRLATNAQNNANRGISSTNKSGYKGVSWRKEKGKWLAQIMVNKRSRFLGYFDDPESASRAYQQAAIEHFGQFARFE